MYWYTRAAAKRIRSSALMADAWHHRSDALSSVGSFIGIFGARIGFPVLDPLAGVVIAFFVLKAAVSIFLEAIGRMTDRASDDATIHRIFEIVSAQENVLGVDQIKTRVFGDKIYVDVEISADGEATLRETHAVAEQVHDAIEDQLPMVKHCMVHVNPH
jgi:cation diffusion facilitator family transporter